MGEHSLTPSDEMWEVYLSDPQTEPDPATWRTQIFWPVAG
jgi:AraC family transcriptional regulator